jgi:hypothetical protein
MAKLVDRLDKVIPRIERSLSFSKETFGEKLDKFDSNGSSMFLVSEELYFLGVASYIQSGDIKLYRSYLVESSELVNRLFKIPFNKNSSSQLFVLRRYKEIFIALSVGSFMNAIEISKVLGGRYELEKEFDDEFSQAVGYTLKKLLHDDTNWTSQRLLDIKQAAIRFKMPGFAGIGDIFQGIINSDQELIDFGFKKFLQEYKKQCKGHGMFVGLTEELLCVWGIGLANLVLYKGMKVNVEDDMMPRELLVYQQE